MVHSIMDQLCSVTLLEVLRRLKQPHCGEPRPTQNLNRELSFH